MALETLQSNLLTPDTSWKDNSYWSDKGEPFNYGQIETSFGHKIVLLAWGQPTQDKIEVLCGCVDLLHPKLVLPTSYILFDNVDMPSPYNPLELCPGYRRRPERAIQFYPHAYTSTIDHEGLTNVSIWPGAIIHEFAHNQDFYPEIMEAWRQEFGWVRLHKPKVVVASDGSRIEVEHECSQKDRLITRYADHKPSEDFSESMVAALLCPNRLDAGKLEFIQRYF